MANRPIFLINEIAPYYSTFIAEFAWAKGLSMSQKRKNIDAIHKCFMNEYPNKKVLEISSKSKEYCGVSASAFNLKKYVSIIDDTVPVENIYQSSKVFKDGGPYVDLLNVLPIEAKRDARLNSSGNLIGYRFEGIEYPSTPPNAFYDFIYINALIENPHIGDQLMNYYGFTDIAFNPGKGINCQARSAAIYVSLRHQGMIQCAKNFRSFSLLINN